MRFIDPATGKEIADMGERGVMVQCDDCAGTGIIGDEGPGMKNAVHEWQPCPCKEAPKITEEQVKDWLNQQSLSIKESLGETRVTLHMESCVCISGSKPVHFHAYASDEPRISPKFGTVQECVDWLILEKSKQITNKMQEVTA